MTGLEEPALALTRPPGRAGRHEDGFLTASEIGQLVLNAELVTLSACDTARGELSSGDGIASLASAFLASGARGVVVTTWSVADEATEERMEAFYEGLTAGLAPPQALRAAKLRLLRGGTGSGPGSGERGVRGILVKRGDVQLVFPNPYHRDPHLEAGRVVTIPEGDEFTFEVDEPVGTERIKAVASSEPFAETEAPFRTLARTSRGMEGVRAIRTRGLRVKSARAALAEATCVYSVVP